MRVVVVVLAALVMGLTQTVRAQEFYSATQPRFFDPLDANSMYYNLPGTRPRILFDDVSVPFSAPTSLFRVTKVTVKISRDTNAPGVTISPYYSQIVPDSSYNGGLSDFPEYPDVGPPTLFATPAILAPLGGAPFTEQTVIFGNGSTPLFTVPGSTLDGNPGFHRFALGLELSSADVRNGWTIAVQSNNLDLLWDYVGSSSFSEFTYNVDSSGAVIVGTQYLRVDGEVYSALPGDASGDGVVNIRDLVALANHWQQSATYGGGDFNFDGIVNATDLGILAQHWQSGSSLTAALPSVGLDPSLIPEPAALSLCLLALPLTLRRRSRER